MTPDKLLIPGYVGDPTPEELSKIQKALLNRPALRRKWKINGYPTKSKILQRALYGVKPDKRTG